jgi:hypothetical protein
MAKLRFSAFLDLEAGDAELIVRSSNGPPPDEPGEIGAEVRT